MSSQVVLVTGGNTGLGLEIIRTLYQSSKAYNILLGSRSLEKAKVVVNDLLSEARDTTTTIEPVKIDVEDDASILSAYAFVEKKYGRLDVLVNNAGANFDRQLHKGEMTAREAWNKSWAINTTGAHVTTLTFIPLLLQSADPRLLFIASGTSTLTGHEKEERFTDTPPAKGWPKQELSWSAYRSAKTGMNMMMREWARILKNDGVKVWAVSPGLLATGLGGDHELLKKLGAIHPRVGAEVVQGVIEGKRDADVGRVVKKDGVQPW
ncbi:NAD(P)-binding protein [Trichoderma citrinoviride]|uniref:NAD(P)-binding protein n=1 Tax=Trichoderma citrinoviride TaxID=58853 RepID=A0A2T4AX43_9HYPO|nr:NAD(P)-binding protein [Trichoderma citrinoviride]PTB61645.1 NAD(P)-binding protein [Trichoderma citrinoviride]